MKRLWIALCILPVMISCAERKGIIPVYLRAEYKINAFIDVPAPRLSWELEAVADEQYQTAYQVLVASSAGLLDQDQGDLWDSGKVDTNATNQVEYGGNPLAARTRVYWKVRSWDKNGEP